MSLGLVCYDDSEDDSDNDDNSPNGSVTNNTPSKIGNTSTAVKNYSEKQKELECFNISDEEAEPETSLENTSKLYLPESKVSLINTDIDIKCLTSTSKRNGPVKITIPSLCEVEDDGEPPSRKKLKPAQKGSGLFALLPNPKSSLVPQSVMKKNITTVNKHDTTVKSNKRMTPKPVSKSPVTNKSSLINYEDSGDEDESSGTVDFFSLDRKDEVTPAPVDIDLILPQVSDSPKTSTQTKDEDEALTFNDSFQPPSWHAPSHSQVPSSTTVSVSEYPTSEFMSFNSSNLELDQDAMQQLCGRRDRLKMQEVSVIDVSGDQIMPDSREWLTKQLTEEPIVRSSHKKKDGPTSQQKRKHQITYLAFQAKENEMELKNQWSNNRMSRKQTQAKYGF